MEEPLPWLYAHLMTSNVSAVLEKPYVRSAGPILGAVTAVAVKRGRQYQLIAKDLLSVLVKFYQ